MNAPASLVLEHVHKSFDKREVLKGIDLTVAEHEVVCLIGASGSGKSTLLRCINLIEPINAGRIFVQGREITKRGLDVNEVRRGIGIVFQSFNLFPHMSPGFSAKRRASEIPWDDAIAIGVSPGCTV